MALELMAMVAAILAGGWWWWTRARSRGTEAGLGRISFGDPGRVERLIEGERRRASGAISRAEAARRAVERHRRDNR